MANILQITPFIHVADLPAAVAFLRDLLGFTVVIEGGPNYAYLQRETAGLRIMKASESPGEEVPPGNRRFMYYLDVRDLKALYDEFKPKFLAAGLPLNEPVTQRYGQQELMILAPDGNLIVFGQELPYTPTNEV